jgi:alcohol dehydrogenase class IV
MITPELRGITGTFTFLPMDDIVTGPGAIAQLGGILETHGVERALLITGHTLFAHKALLQSVCEAAGGRIAGVFYETRQHVPRQVVLDTARRAQEIGADALISFGGGSPNDTAKTVAMALAEEIRTLADFDRLTVKFEYPDKVEVPAVTGAALPIFAIPTTLSAGEFTHFAAATDEHRQVKDLYISKKLTARAVILDPELTLATPQWLWNSSGIRAVDHAVEALCSTTAHPFTDALAVHALRMLSRFLRMSNAAPEDLAARLQCQIAAWMSVCGLANVSLGLSHGIGHQLGARCGVPHGVTSCVMMGEVMRFNRAHVGDRAGWILDAVGKGGGPQSGPEAADRAADALQALITDLGLPTRLRDVGVTRDDFALLARDALQDIIVATNSRPVSSQQDVIDVLERAY